MIKKPNGWTPMSKPRDLKVMGKLGEEASELATVAARCVIQGVDEREPTTGKLNREWLEDEIADVLAHISVNVQYWQLDSDRIEKRCEAKRAFQLEWCGMRDPD